MRRRDYRRARRQLRRRYGTRTAPVVLIDEPYPGAGLAAAGRILFRYRSELAPFALAATAGLVALFLHTRHPGWWPGLIVATVLGTAAVAWLGRRWLPRLIERAYAAGVVFATGTWVVLATVYGPGAGPLPKVLGLGTIVAGVPWWWHRRRRARVQVERTLEAWPEVGEQVGLAGSRVMSALVDAWGWRARIALRKGQTVADALNRLPALESGLGTRPGALRIEADPHRADHVLLRVLNRDPHAEPLPWPGGTARSINEPAELGIYEDAGPVRVSLLRRHGLIGGVAGSGKSGVLNVVLAILTGCRDVVLWGIDLKGGMELQPWGRCLDRLATTPGDAAELLADAVRVLDARAADLARRGARVWEPSHDRPALVIVVDEYAELDDEALRYADSLARRGRAPAVTLLAATQRPTQDAMGNGAVRSQMDVRICLRVCERRDVDLVLGQGMLAAGWNAHTLDAAGAIPRRAPAIRLPARRRRTTPQSRQGRRR
ncbi:FtsK/SpoIIIE domain-containing protein [Cryptosporangium phraense]|uniref:Cell division protein FtsK n=1 Tax=Cryptosporangium phraense TaxID=2593070 RepID=A0A545AXW4_9ACTN|nr:FtsK/SpoIIIE domain-containing protein [Cryptosporangium phraense]TQS46176.1 cell division protein FtsK [Cryptosporangium phraense]